jgi:hypothetical protein
MGEHTASEAERHVDEEDRAPAELAIRTPPSDGPSAVPIADAVPSRPIALPVRAFGTTSPTNASESAIMTAAPRPCTARATITSHSAGARPATIEASREQQQPGQQQPPTADPIAEPADADDQGGDREEVGEHDPLAAWNVASNAWAQRSAARRWRCWCRARQQHRERQGGERPRATAAMAHGGGGGCVGPGGWAIQGTPSFWPAQRGACPGQTWRKTHHMHFIRAFDAMSRRRYGRAVERPDLNLLVALEVLLAEESVAARRGGCGSARPR